MIIPQAANVTSALYRHLIPAMWIAWAAYWWISSRAVKANVRRDTPLSRLAYHGPLVLAALLLMGRIAPVPLLEERFVPQAPWLFIVAAALTGAGILFSVWARRHLGAYWSATVTIKEGHQLITTGPYAIVRHPIYTGLLLALVGTALAVGEWRGVVAVALAAVSIYPKIRLEERWMREQFGEKYRAYCQHVPALIPFVI